MLNKFILTPFIIHNRFDEIKTLVKPNWVINEPTLSNGSSLLILSGILQSLATHVFNFVQRGFRPISIAGDCCSSMGLLAGLQRAGIKPDILWLDAHGDFNTTETSPTQFLGGMPLAMIAGLGDQTLVNAVGLEPIPVSKITLSDARNLDPGESELLKKMNIRHLSHLTDLMNDSFPARPVYLHFDTDLLDPKDAPVLYYPESDGPALKEITEILHFISQRLNIVAITMVTCWNPKRDEFDQMKEACFALLSELL